MADLLLIIAGICSLSWFWLLMFHNNFWRADQRLSETFEALEKWPTIAIVVPARNESDVVDRTVNSLTQQNYPGEYQIFLIDDHSVDKTFKSAMNSTSSKLLTVVQAPPLPAGWTGKNSALAHGVSVAKSHMPEHEYLLFTDADIEHPKNSLRTLVTKAKNDHCDLVSLMVRLHCRQLWEKLLIPAFVFFFQKIYPFPAVNEKSSNVAAAAGGVVLVRRTALEKIGGIEEIRFNLIDDCALASLIKKNQGRLWLGLANKVCSIRPYQGLQDIWNMVARNAFSQLKYSPIFLVGSVIGMILVYLSGPGIFLTYYIHSSNMASSLGLLCWFLMSLAYLPTVKYYGLSPIWTLTLPLVGFLYTLMTIDSAVRHWCNKEVCWKGRTYKNLKDIK